MKVSPKLLVYCILGLGLVVAADLMEINTPWNRGSQGLKHWRAQQEKEEAEEAAFLVQASEIADEQGVVLDDFDRFAVLFHEEKRTGATPRGNDLEKAIKLYRGSYGVLVQGRRNIGQPTYSFPHFMALSLTGYVEAEGETEEQIRILLDQMKLDFKTTNAD